MSAATVGLIADPAVVADLVARASFLLALADSPSAQTSCGPHWDASAQRPAPPQCPFSAQATPGGHSWSSKQGSLQRPRSHTRRPPVKITRTLAGSSQRPDPTSQAWAPGHPSGIRRRTRHPNRLCPRRSLPRRRTVCLGIDLRYTNDCRDNQRRHQGSSQRPPGRSDRRCTLRRVHIQQARHRIPPPHHRRGPQTVGVPLATIDAELIIEHTRPRSQCSFTRQMGPSTHLPSSPH